VPSSILLPNQLIGTGSGYSDASKQKIFGVSLNTDFGGPFASAEFLCINRDADYGGDRAQLYAVPEAHRSVSAVLRYDLNNTTAIKAQYDIWTDKAGPGFGSMYGNSKVLTFSIDKVF
jgi:hypothetical protein